jgi:hypothetical protein
VYSAIAHLQEINVAGDGLVGRLAISTELNAMLAFQCGDVGAESHMGTSTASVTESFASMKR